MNLIQRGHVTALIIKQYESWDSWLNGLPVAESMYYCEVTPNSKHEEYILEIHLAE